MGGEWGSVLSEECVLLRVGGVDQLCLKSGDQPYVRSVNQSLVGVNCFSGSCESLDYSYL